MLSGWCGWMANPMDDFGSDSFRVLLNQGTKGAGPKAEALEAISLRPVWLATWEPRAEGFRTLINAEGEEALAIFSSEKELKAAAARFGWLEPDGTVIAHRAIGGDILRHAWTREYAFIVVDVGSDHTLEYARTDLKQILRDLDSTGPFRTSRPPPPANAMASSSFPPPVERSSTVYSMGPTQSEKIDRLSDLPTKPHEALPESEPPTKPRAAVTEGTEIPRRPASSRPAKRPKSEPPKIEEVRARAVEPGDLGTYGAASIIPSSQRRPKSALPDAPRADEDAFEDSSHPASSSAPKLNSDAPTAPGASRIPSAQSAKLELPSIGPIGAPPIVPEPPRKAQPVRTEKPRIAAPSIGDGIKLVPISEAPDDVLLGSLSKVMQGYFEIEWGSYCQVARPGGPPSAGIAIRVADNYRDNVTAIIKDLCEAARKHDVEIDVLLVDGHDMLRKSREHGFVFYPWKPKPFGA